MNNQQAGLYRKGIAALDPRRIEVVNYDTGKSPLFMDAMADCLFEEGRDGQLGGWLREGEKSGAVTFEFEMGGAEYRVVRTRTQSGKTTLAFNRRSEGGDWEDCGDSSTKLTQAKIEEMLGMATRTVSPTGKAEPATSVDRKPPAPKDTDAIRKAANIIIGAQMLCEGLTPADCQMEERQFVNATAGAFSLLAPMLARAYDLLMIRECEGSAVE